MAKERILVPENLRPRLERVVKKLAKELKATEQDARRIVEVSALTRGLESLEREGTEA